VAHPSFCPRQPNHYPYRAEQYDSDLGLYYLRARYYNSLTGRFISRDPEGGDPSDPRSLHKYLYADGDPINGLDPMGREDEVGEEEGEIGTASEPPIRNLGQTLDKCFEGIAISLLGVYDLYKSGGSPLRYGLAYYGLVRVAGCLIEYFPEPPMPRPIPEGALAWASASTFSTNRAGRAVPRLRIPACPGTGPLPGLLSNAVRLVLAQP